MDSLLLILYNSNPIFPSHAIMFMNLTIIYYNNKSNNRDQIYCSFLVCLLVLSSTLSSTSSIRFIFISGLSINTNYIGLIYYTCYPCMLSTNHNNEKLMNLKCLVCYCCCVSFIPIVFYWQHLSRSQSLTLLMKSAQLVNLLRHLNLLKLKKWQM